MKAIVTGGNRGIGLAVTQKLVAKGFEVHVLSRSPMQGNVAHVHHWPVDLGDYEHTKRVVEAIGDCSVLVNNAGMMNPKTVLDYEAPEIIEILNVNLISAVRLSALMADRMSQKGGGRIVSVASIAGEVGHPDIWYGISKAGLINGMRSLARSFGAQGVIANCVAPGPVDTDMMALIPVERQTRLKAATISQRFATVDEVSAAIVWLATDSPACFNGDVVDLNNGANYR